MCADRALAELNLPNYAKHARPYWKKPGLWVQMLDVDSLKVGPVNVRHPTLTLKDPFCRMLCQ
jgi:hypothetical protein